MTELRKLHVIGIIEEDTDRVLLAAVDMAKEERVSFHLHKDGDGGQVSHLIAMVKAGEHVEVEL